MRLEGIESARQELMDVTRTYAQQAGAAVRRAIRLGDREGRKGLRRVAREWAGCFSRSFVERMGTATTTASMLKIMQVDYKSDEKLVDSLATLLVGQPLARWGRQHHRDLRARAANDGAADRGGGPRTQRPAGGQQRCAGTLEARRGPNR